MNKDDQELLLHKLELTVMHASTVTTWLQALKLNADTIAIEIPDNTIEADCLKLRDSTQLCITEAMGVQSELDQVLAKALELLKTEGE